MKKTFLIVFVLVAFVLATSPLMAHGETLPGEIQIPEESDWTDHGPVLKPGGKGAWDVRFSGALTPATVIKRDGQYYLYYVGSDGNRQDPPGDDGGPRHRALGLATSEDGLTYSKSDDNPVLAYFPTPNGVNAQEEGIFSATAQYVNGKVYLYFAGDTQTNATQVRADTYLAVSSDGQSFSRPRLVLSATDRSVWGNEGRNDENHVVGSFVHGGRWHLLYNQKNLQNRREEWSLGLASGPAPTRLNDSEKFLLRSKSSFRGKLLMVSAARIASDKFAVFVVERLNRGTNLEVRTLRANDPTPPSNPTETYGFFRGTGSTHATVFLDQEAGKWFMFYFNDTNRGNAIRLKTAEVRYENGSPPPAQRCFVKLGNKGYCGDCGSCLHGQGDCDTDENCAEGTCVDDVGRDYGFSGWVDVCVDPPG